MADDPKTIALIQEHDDALPVDLPEEEDPGGLGVANPVLSVPREELRRALVAGRLFVLKKTKSKQLAKDLVPEAYYRLRTTRAWNPEKVSFMGCFFGVLKSLISNQKTSKAPERELEAAEGFYREEQPRTVGTVLDAMERAEEENAKVARAERELAELRRRIAGHPLMPGVLACKEEGMTPAETAKALGRDIKEVYSATQLLKHHLRRLREDYKNEEGEDG